MKAIRTLLFFLPLILFVFFIFLNFSVLQQKYDTNVFWMFSGNLPLFLFISLFFSIYVITIWFMLRFSDFFSERKNKRMEEKVNSLKAELYDNQAELIDSITNDFRGILSKFQKENNDMVLAFKSENQKVVSGIEYELQNIKSKLQK